MWENIIKVELISPNFSDMNVLYLESYSSVFFCDQWQWTGKS